MMDNNILLELLTDFINSILDDTFSNIILIQDNYFCIPEDISKEKIVLKNQNNSPFFIISHQLPVKRETIKISCERQFQAKNFIIVYDTTEILNDQFLDEFKQYNFNYDFTPNNLINYWLEEDYDLDDSLNFLSYFIWDLKDFIIDKRDKIIRIKSLNDNIKFTNIIEIILKNSFVSLIEKGNLIKLLNDKNSWKLRLIFKQSNYVYKKIFKIFDTNLKKIGINDQLFNYIENMVLIELNFNEILKIFLITNFMEKLGINFVTSINFNSIVEEFIKIHDDSKKNSVKNLNRSQIFTFSEIFINYLMNLYKLTLRADLIKIFSLIRELSEKIINKPNLREITIEPPSFQELDIYKQCLKLSNLEYFYYSPLRISEIFFEYFKSKIGDKSWRFNIEDGGKIKKVADNIETGNLLKFSKNFDPEYQEIINFYNYFYNLCYNLFLISSFISHGFINWDFRRWTKFYSNYYIKLIENLDGISKIHIRFNDYKEKCNEIINWINLKFFELKKAISSKFFEFIKLKYPDWVLNSNNINLCPLMTSNVFERFISKNFRRPLNNNFIILNDGCTLDNWKVIKKQIKNDFKDFEFEEVIGYSIIPSKTWWSRKAIFIGDFMNSSDYFRKGESHAFLELLKRVKGIRRNPGNHNSFFNTKCEKYENFQRVKDNIAAGFDLTQIIIFNFSDILNESSFDQKDVKEAIHKIFYPKIKELLEIILRTHSKPNIFFITDHGIIETREIIQNLAVVNNQGQKFPLYRLREANCCNKTPRLLEIKPNFTLNLSSIPTIEKEKFLVIDNLSEFGLVGDRYNTMVIASSFYSFSTPKKAHGGISMTEMIIPFSRMVNKPIISKSDFKKPIIKIENKEEFETSTNILKISILNENSENLSNLKLHLITTNTHQIQRKDRIQGNQKKKFDFFSNDKSTTPIKVKLSYKYKYNKFSDEFEFKLSLEDYTEELKSHADDLLDDEI